MIQRLLADYVRIQGFDAVKGDFYEIIGCDDEEIMCFECIRSGNVAFKYLRLKDRNIWIIKGHGELLFAEKITEDKNGR
jgi:hypothetical protein